MDPMVAVVAFAATLLVAVLVSALANRTILSTAVVFLAAGFLLGDGVFGVVPVDAGDPVVGAFAELALFSVLFSDGMRVTVNDLRTAGRLPGRALLLGLPLTLLGTAVLAHLVAGIPWLESFLLGAVLSPTDPVFAAALVGREEVPYRLRRLLNVESGLNDGLALPVVLVLLAVVGNEQIDAFTLITELIGGVAIGVAIPYVAIKLERTRAFAATSAYEPLNAFAIGLLVLGIAAVTHANEFLAAFSAGITVATMSPAIRNAFHRFGELVAELLKLAALLLFGALISPAFLGEVSVTGYVFVVLALVLARPVALAFALVGAELSRQEWIAAAWFGPKGFASVVYGLLVLKAGIARGDELFHLIAAVIALSIVAHASSDVPVAKWFRRAQPDEIGEGLSGDDVDPGDEAATEGG